MIVFAALLMILDQRIPIFHLWRNKLSIAVYPVQMVVSTPVKVERWLASSMSSQQHVLEDNARLRAHELLLQSKLQKLLTLERENAQLREILKSTSTLSAKVTVAQILAVGLDPSLQQVVINKGSKQHVYVGQPVLDAYGVIGQVIDVGALTSKVLLVTDNRFAVPVQDLRNGLRAIATGLGSAGQLELINVPDTWDIKKGDMFVTSGMGIHYPVGYPVGQVMQLAHVPGRRFALIRLKPAAHFDSSHQVILAWPSQRKLAKAVQQELDKKVPMVGRGLKDSADAP